VHTFALLQRIVNLFTHNFRNRIYFSYSTTQVQRYYQHVTLG